MPSAAPPALELSAWARVEEGGSTALVEGWAGGGSPVRFRLEAVEGRLRVGLLLPQHERPLDLSREPAVLTAALAPVAEPQALVAAGEWLAGFATRHRLWASQPAELRRGLTGAGFPLLREPYDRGAGALAEIPRWAAPTLVERSARGAAATAFGARVNRPAVAALARSLVPEQPGSPPDLLPLGLVLMAGPVLTADAIARVLRSGAGRPDAGGPLPSVADVTRFRRHAAWLGPDRVARLLVGALTEPNGLRLLLRTSRLLDGLPAAHRHRLPTRLRPLHDRCHELTPLDPRPPDEPHARIQPRRPAPVRARRRAPSAASVARAPGEARPAPAVVAGAAPAPRPDPAYGTRGLVAPATRAAGVPPAAVLPHRPAVAVLHGHRIAPHLRLVLPRTVAELQTWGHRLHNCLGTYGAAAVEGRSVLIGVERGDVLTYCAEVTPGSGRIRQLLGPHNRAVPRADADLVVAALRRAGVVSR